MRSKPSTTDSEASARTMAAPDPGAACAGLMPYIRPGTFLVATYLGMSIGMQELALRPATGIAATRVRSRFA